jgi:hypothetical protein
VQILGLGKLKYFISPHRVEELLVAEIATIIIIAATTPQRNRIGRSRGNVLGLFPGGFEFESGPGRRLF